MFKSEHVMDVMLCVVNAVPITYSVALNRPAYQSSVYSNNNGHFYASLANDGNLDTHMARGNTPTCSHSLRETNPWWAVDLGKPTAVHRVDLTNIDSSGT